MMENVWQVQVAVPVRIVRPEVVNNAIPVRMPVIVRQEKVRIIMGFAVPVHKNCVMANAYRARDAVRKLIAVMRKRLVLIILVCVNINRPRMGHAVQTDKHHAVPFVRVVQIRSATMGHVVVNTNKPQTEPVAPKGSMRVGHSA